MLLAGLVGLFVFVFTGKVASRFSPLVVLFPRALEFFRLLSAHVASSLLYPAYALVYFSIHRLASACAVGDHPCTVSFSIFTWLIMGGRPRGGGEGGNDMSHIRGVPQRWRRFVSLPADQQQQHV
jgi:hypothetical protein